MDNMPLSFDLPGEDEIAVNVSSSGYSYYMALIFMKQEEKYRKNLDFEEGSEEEAIWTRTFIDFFRKIIFREQR